MKKTIANTPFASTGTASSGISDRERAVTVRSCMPMAVLTPHKRLTRAVHGTTFCRTPRGEGRTAVSPADQQRRDRSHQGGHDASPRLSWLRSGCPSGHDRRLPIVRFARRQTSPRNQNLLDADARLDSLARLVAGRRVYTRRDGIDRRLLEAGLQPARRPLRVDRGQCAAYQSRARTQDRCQGCRVDLRPPAPRAAASELCAAARVARTARPATLPAQT